MKIAIDIGHANGTGARGNGLEEHAVATRITSHLVVMLKEKGHKVEIIDFPEMSNADDLNATIKAANAGGYDLGISIHCDCSDNSQAHGAHVCYLSSSGKRLADAIAEPLCKFLPGRSEKTVRRENLAVLKHTNPVWVLCECGFISHPAEAAIMKDTPDAIAQQIVVGVQAFTR